MINNIYYKTFRWGNTQIYKYKDTIQVELTEHSSRKSGLVMTNIDFSPGLYQLIFDLDVNFEDPNESVFYTNSLNGSIKKYLKIGQNKIIIPTENMSTVNLYFLVDNPIAGKKFKLSNLYLYKCSVLTSDIFDDYLNSNGVFSICYDNSNCNDQLINTFRSKYNLFDEYDNRNACLFVLPCDINIIKQHKGQIYIYFENDLLREKYITNIKSVKYIDFKIEEIVKQHCDENTQDKSLEIINEKKINSIISTQYLQKSDSLFTILDENLSLKENMENVLKSKNAINICMEKGKSNLYKIVIYDYKSLSNSISKCYIVEDTNDKKSKISLIPYSNISPNLDINYLFIDINRYLRNFTVVIYNPNDTISIGNYKVTDVSANNMRTECINLQTKYLESIKIYLNNKIKKYNVLCILDEFSSECFSYELNLTHLTKDNIKTIDPNNYDFFLCESAWHGYNGCWSGSLIGIDRIPNVLLKTFITNLTIPKVFYGKEDPIKFSSFKDCAKYFNKHDDLIITTDIGIVGEYKKLGCKNVTFFPFCCQPIIHNPINRVDNDNIIFPCSWYGASYPERCIYMKDMIDRFISTDKLDIYDRQYLFNKLTMQTDDQVVAKFRGHYCFPDEYVDIIKGQLSYHQVLDAYKNYGIVMNANTITDSDTMFSRRVIEAFACGCSIITNKSSGMQNMFGEAYIEYGDPNSIKLMNNKDFRNKIQYMGHCKVMNEYTYSKMIDEIEKNIYRTNPTKINIQKSKTILIIYLYRNSIKKTHTLDKLSNYAVITQEITKPFTAKCTTYDYIFIMGDWFEYDEKYVTNSLIPFNFADIRVTGKGCYLQQNLLIGENLENRFTNSLHPFSLIIKGEELNNILEGNIFNNVISFLRNIKSDLSYSYYRYDFKDDGTFCSSFDINSVNEISGNNLSSLKKCKNFVIMCNWKRTYRIKQILYNLSLQDTKDFVFCIWNNNNEDANELTKLLETTKVDFQIATYNSQINIGGFGRFLMAKYVTENCSAENILFFDDDQEIPRQFVSDYSNRINNNITLNFFGRKFVKGRPYCEIDKDGKLNYELSNKCIENVNNGGEFLYGGTGGKCLKAFVFNDKILYTIPIKFLYCEDLWLSWIVKTQYNMKIIKSGIQIKTIGDKLDQCTGLWNIKIEFLEFLRKQLKWDV